MSACWVRVCLFPPIHTPAGPPASTLPLQLPASLSRLLIKAGFSDVVAAEKFLQPRLQDLSDPFLLSGVRGGVYRILEAIDRKPRIVPYGDYDVHELTSLATLNRILPLD